MIEKTYGPAELVEQNIKTFRTNAATLRAEAAQKMDRAEKLETRAQEWELALDQLRKAQ